MKTLPVKEGFFKPLSLCSRSRSHPVPQVSLRHGLLLSLDHITGYLCMPSMPTADKTSPVNFRWLIAPFPSSPNELTNLYFFINILYSIVSAI
jgi:hypothetical protein